MDSLEQDGGDPHDPLMEARVTRLEGDMSDVRTILVRLEPMIARIEATLPFLATKAEMLGLRAEMAEQFSQERADTAAQFSQGRAETAAQFSQGRADTAAQFAQVRADTAAQFAQVRAETAEQFARVRVELAGKPSFAGMWACGATLMAIALGGMAAGAVYMPFLFHVMHMPPP